MRTFRHAGDLGDIVYSMPVMRALCGDEPGALLIEATHYTRQPLTPDKWCGLDQLLLRQPYVAEVRPWIKGEPVTYNLNDFRARMFPAVRMGIGRDKHLTHWMCDVHGVNYNCMNQAWLTVEDPISAARVVFSRAGAGRPSHQVYQNELFPWYIAAEKYRKDAVFVGGGLEHQVFEAAFGPVPHYKTATLLEAARVIAGCELFVGNQTATHAIAEGMKKRIVLEVWMGGPNCLVHDKPRVTHGKDPYVQLPDL